jgi:hypothetical protein
MRRTTRIVVTLVLVAAVATIGAIFVGAATAAWSNYYPTATMHDVQGENYGTSGNAPWTNNRVYRPLGYNFVLAYDDGTYHFSSDNSTDNPFLWPAYGYSYLQCVWDYNTNYTSLYPVTCDGYQ